jgi:hypothetical protein
MSIKQQGGVFGRSPSFNDVEVEGDLNVNGPATFNSSISGTTGSFSGNLAVDTNVLFVDAANNRVGAGTATPTRNLSVNGLLGVGNGTIEVITAFSDRGVFGTQSNHDLEIRTNGGEKIRVKTTGEVGIGTASPSEKLSVSGNVTITGSLSKGSGSFKIDHPIKPDTHHLVHSFIEGPQADNLYRGRIVLVDGFAAVNLDEAGRMTEGTFVALNGNVQCFTTNEEGWTQVRGKVKGNILTIEAQDATCTDEVSWLVIGERHDPHMIDATWTDENGRVIVEPEKIIAPEMEAE